MVGRSSTKKIDRDGWMALEMSKDSEFAVHPKLEEVFVDLSRSSVHWLLFRGEERLNRPTGDIDLLVSLSDKRRADGILCGHGFVRLGTGTLIDRVAYVFYHVDTKVWLKIDLVTRVSFGVALEFDTSLADSFLECRVESGPLFLPSRDDAFWHLLVHYMLDKGGIPEPWRETLRLRSTHTSSTSSLERFLRSIGADTDLIVNAVSQGDWSYVEEEFQRIRRVWWRAQAVGVRRRFAAQKILQRVGLGTWTSFRPGFVVAILGPDGAGKSTLSARLREGMEMPCRDVYMGLWKKGLPERIAGRIPGVETIFMLLRLITRQIRLSYYRWRGKVVVLDRYTTDALLVSPTDSWKQRATSGLVAMLSRSPDLYLVLDLPGEVAFSRKGEEDVETLERWRQTYRSLSYGDVPVKFIDATLTAEEVASIALSTVWEHAQRR